MTLPCAEMTGVACGVCGQECFQVAVREAVLSETVRVKVSCCLRCVRRVDMDNEERDAQLALEGVSKPGRREAFREESFRWADGWNGQHVLVRYDVGDGYPNPADGFPKHCQIKGMAHRMKNACGGWGRLSIVLDQAELSRVTHGHHARYGWLAHDRLDGFEWSPALVKGMGGETYSFEITWGERHDRVLEKIV